MIFITFAKKWELSDIYTTFSSECNSMQTWNHSFLRGSEIHTPLGNQTIYYKIEHMYIDITVSFRIPWSIY